jgi:hypothetical protein
MSARTVSSSAHFDASTKLESLVKSSRRQPIQLFRADPPRPNKYSSANRPAKVVSISGLRISEPRRTLVQIYERGIQHYQAGRFAEACLDFKQAGQDPQQLASCILMVSRCYLRSGQPEKATALLNAAIGRTSCQEGEALLFKQELALLEPVDASGGPVFPARTEMASKVVRLLDASSSEDRVQTAPPVAEVQEVPPVAEVKAVSPVAGGGTESRAADHMKNDPAAEKVGELQAEPQAAPAVDLYAAPTSKLVTVPFGILVTLVIMVGFFLRGEQRLTAESGPGYLFGIIGSLLMMLLMLYPLRKKARFMRNWGPIPLWFRLHMLFGIIGPVLVLFHANFQLGSVNSRVVLGSALLVAGSGIFGRYLYTKIHYGLYGKRISLEHYHAAISSNQDHLAAVFTYAPKIKERLLSFDASVLRPSSGVFDSILRVLVVDLRRRWTHLRIQLVLRRAFRVAARRNHWSRRERRAQYRAANKLITRHLIAVLKVAEFSFYERFFSLWHVFHMPLFLLLVITLLMHVIAVHMY